MDDLWTLILLSLAMLIGCYVAGMIPLSITLSEVLLQKIERSTLPVIKLRAGHS